MAITPKAAALALLLGSAAAGTGWAQTATPAEPAEDAAPATTEAPVAQAPAEAAAEPAPANGAAAPAADAAPAEDAAAATAETAAVSAPDAVPVPPSGPAASRDEAAIGQYFIDATHGDWTLRCIKAPEEGTDPCELYQLLKDEAGNSVSEVSFIPLAGEAAAGATFVAPLETDLIAGLGMMIDSGRQQGFPFNFCAPVGCVARVGFTQAELDTLKRGNAATISLLPYGAESEGRVDLRLSLRGFTAGMDAVASKMPPPEAHAN